MNLSIATRGDLNRPAKRAITLVTQGRVNEGKIELFVILFEINIRTHNRHFFVIAIFVVVLPPLFISPTSSSRSPPLGTGHVSLTNIRDIRTRTDGARTCIRTIISFRKRLRRRVDVPTSRTRHTASSLRGGRRPLFYAIIFFSSFFFSFSYIPLVYPAPAAALRPRFDFNDCVPDVSLSGTRLACSFPPAITLAPRQTDTSNHTVRRLHVPLPPAHDQQPFVLYAPTVDRWDGGNRGGGW